MPPTPSALRGSVLVHDNDPSMLAATIAALDAPPTDTIVRHDGIAKAAGIMMQIVGAVAPDIQSLRDIAFMGRHSLDGAEHKFVQTLNAAYAIMRHLPGAEIERRATRIAQTLAATISEHHSERDRRTKSTGGSKRVSGIHHNAAMIVDFAARVCSPKGTVKLARSQGTHR